MSMCRFAAEFGLDSRAVNTIFVKTFSNLTCELHVTLRSLVFEFEGYLDVERRDKLSVVKLPDV